MGQGLSQPAEDDQAAPAEEPAGSGGTAERADSGATAAPGAPGAPAEPADAGAQEASAASVPSDAGGGPIAHGVTFTPRADADQDGFRVPAQRPHGGQVLTSALPEESVGGLDGPLLADVEGLRASWQRIQTGFVDDPGEAVADAASLVEHTVQALVGALHQRQLQLRAAWDRGGAPDGAGSASAGQSPAVEMPGTEQLRLLIQQYRALFNQICRP